MHAVIMSLTVVWLFISAAYQQREKKFGTFGIGMWLMKKWMGLNNTYNWFAYTLFDQKHDFSSEFSITRNTCPSINGDTVAVRCYPIWFSSKCCHPRRTDDHNRPIHSFIPFRRRSCVCVCDCEWTWAHTNTLVSFSLVLVTDERKSCEAQPNNGER